MGDLAVLVKGVDFSIEKIDTFYLEAYMLFHQNINQFNNIIIFFKKIWQLNYLVGVREFHNHTKILV